MPVIFDQVTGTVDPPSNPSPDASPEQTTSPQIARQLLAEMIRDRDKKAARLRAD